MIEFIELIQDRYRKERERVSYSTPDIGIYLQDLAEKGLIWMIKDLKDTCEAEAIVIEYYLNEYRSKQIYDNLEDIFHLHFSDESCKIPPYKSSQNTMPIKKLYQKQQNHLEVKNVNLFNGYKMSKELEEKIIELCKKLPSYERNHIVDQILRSSSSIKERIAKGEQIYIGEKFYQYSISIGSAKETAAWLQMSLGQGYLTQFEFEKLDNLVTRVVSILTKNLSNLKNNEGKGMDLPNPFTPNVKKFGAYQNALVLVEKIYEITREKSFWNEKYIVGNVRKCATSCVANIAEAHQLYTPKKFSFFNRALQALGGVGNHLDTAIIKGIVMEKDLKDIELLMNSIRYILLSRLGNLSKQKAS